MQVKIIRVVEADSTKSNALKYHEITLGVWVFNYNNFGLVKRKDSGNVVPYGHDCDKNYFKDEETPSWLSLFYFCLQNNGHHTI